jgi:hypothetical protein
VADAEHITVANLSATVLSVFRWFALHCTARISSMHSVWAPGRLSVHHTENGKLGAALGGPDGTTGPPMRHDR